jgi:hypothetical protein
MNLRSPTRNIIKKDSRASIKTEGLLGDKYVEISFGSPKAETVVNNDTIASETPKDVSEQARALTDEAQAAVAAFREDMEALQHNFRLRGFFEKRGYNDTSELTAHAISGLPAQKPAKEFEYNPKEIFDKPDNASIVFCRRLESQSADVCVHVVASLDATPPRKTAIALLIFTLVQPRTMPCTLQQACAWLFDKKGAFWRIQSSETIHMVVAHTASHKVAVIRRHCLDMVFRCGLPIYSFGFVVHRLIVTGTNRLERLAQHGLQSLFHDTSFLLSPVFGLGRLLKRISSFGSLLGTVRIVG